MLLTEKISQQRLSSYTSNNNLTALHEENYAMWLLLMPMYETKGERFFSCHSNKPKLGFYVKELFPYTTEIELKYDFEKLKSDTMVIRVYRDARLVELQYSSEFEKQIRLMGPYIDIKTQAAMRLNQNKFLNKWLIYLLDNGYEAHKWRAETEPLNSQ